MNKRVFQLLLAIALVCAGSPVVAFQAPQGPPKMTNAEVIQLVTAGLSEQVVNTSIRQAPTKNFDVTPTGLFALKKAGVPDAVILVMLASGAPANPASPPEHTASALAGRYTTVRKKSIDYLDLTVYGTFQLIQGGKNYDGMYRVQGDTITVQGKSIREYRMRLVANTIVEPDGSVWVKDNAGPETQSQTPSVGPANMTNDEVIQLVTGGLSEQVVGASIRYAPTKNFDLTPTGLIALKQSNVSDAVIVAMQERDTPVQAAATSEAKAAVPPKPEPAPVAQDACSGVESMGLYKNEIYSRQMGGGIVEWLAKIRNNTGVTKIVVFGWRDVNGQQRTSQVQIRGGEIASPRVDLTQARGIAPISELRVLSCE